MSNRSPDDRPGSADRESGDGGPANDGPEESFLASSPDPVVTYEFVDGEAVAVDVNPAFERTFGLATTEVVGEPVSTLVTPAGTGSAVVDPSPTERSSVELRCRTTDGAGVFLVRSVPAGDAANEGATGYAIYTDISEHKEIEDRFAALVTSSSDVLTILERDGTLNYVSPSAEEVLGYSPDSLKGEQALLHVHPEDRDRVRREFFTDPADWAGQTRTATYRFRDAEGEWRVVESVARSRLDDPAVEGVVVNSRDVTDRERRKEELELFETIAKTVPVGVIVLDGDANVVWINERGARMAGVDPEAVSGEQFLDAIIDEGIMDESIVDEYMEVARELVSSESDAEKVISEASVYRGGDPDQEQIVDIHFGLLPLEDGEYQGTVNVFRDITQRKEYEHKLEEQNERLEQFTQFVSHDLRNPLNVAKGYVTQAKAGDEAAVDEIEISLERMETLIEELLTMAREGQEAEEPRPVALDAVANAAWSTVDTADATLRAEEGVTLVADRGTLRQLFENLFRNAVEHGSTSSRPEAGGGVGRGVTVRVGAFERDGDRGIYVADDGPGIPPERREQVFEFGYTTNEDGTGFGLGIVERIASAHGWSVRLRESEDGGARFEFLGVETG